MRWLCERDGNFWAPAQYRSIFTYAFPANGSVMQESADSGAEAYAEFALGAVARFRG
jgi:hypothetical protein